MNHKSFFGLIIFTTLFALSCSLATYRNDPSLEDNTSKYIVNFGDYLGEEWVWDGTLRDREDIEGFTRQIVDTTSSLTYHKDNRLSFINHYITKYKDTDAAQDRFTRIRDFVVRMSGSNYSGIDVSRIEAGSDQQFVFCSEIVEENSLKDLQCQGVFQFESFIIYLNVRAVVQNIRYLTDDEILEVFNLAVEPIRLDLGKGDL